MVRARLLDPEQGLFVQDLEETVVGNSGELRDYAPRLLTRLFPSPEPAWYTRWWVWTAAGVVVTAVATTVVMLTRPEKEDPNVVRLGEL